MSTALDMVVSDAELVESSWDLTSLAKEANEQDALAEKAARDWCEHAILAGVALLQAWEQVPYGEWKRWLTANTNIAESQAGRYIRIAFYKDEIQSAGVQTREAAVLVLRGLPRHRTEKKAPRNVPPELRERVRRRHEAGEPWAQIANDLSVTVKTVRSWSDPAVEKRYRNRARELHAAKQRVRKSEQKAYERQERDRLARRTGGDISSAYSLIRRTLQTIDNAIGDAETPEIRTALRSALGHAHRSEDAIVAALRGKEA